MKLSDGCHIIFLPHQLGHQIQYSSWGLNEPDDTGDYAMMQLTGGVNNWKDVDGFVNSVGVICVSI